MRKLLCAATGVLAAAVIAHYFVNTDRLPLIAIIFAALSAVSFLFRYELRLRMLIFFVSGAVFCAWFGLYHIQYAEPPSNLVGEDVTLRIRVTDYADEYRVLGEIETEGYEDIALYVYSYDYDLSALRPGDLVEAEFSFSDASLRSGVEVDSYISKSIYLFAWANTEPKLLSNEPSFQYLPRHIANFVSEKVTQVFPEDVQSFMLALLTGDKSGLYVQRELYSAMGRTGISHVVAISGMHISFLWALSGFLLRGNRKATAVVGIAVVWLFAFVAGATPSAIRAAFMLSLMSLAPFVGREPDPLSALSAAMILLFIANPLTVASVSFQLSFSAMLGLVLFSGKIFERLKPYAEKLRLGVLRKIGVAVAATVSASLGVTVFTVPLVALHFSYVSLVSPITNVLIFFAVSVAFLGGLGAVVLGSLSVVLGSVVGFVVAYMVRYITFCTAVLGAFPYAALYTADTAVIVWLIFAYVVFGFTYAMGHFWQLRYYVPVGIVSLGLALLIFKTSVMSTDTVMTVLDVGQGQSLVFRSEGASVVVDCGGNKGLENVGDIAANYLLANGSHRVDVLVLTHLDYDHISGVTQLMARVKVDTIIYNPKAVDEERYAQEIEAAADASETEIIYATEDMSVSVGAIELSIAAPLDEGDPNRRSLCIVADIDGMNVLVTGDVDSVGEREYVDRGLWGDMDVLVVGHHGSSSSSSLELLHTSYAQTAVISVGENAYGHPAEDVLHRLELYDMEVLRTDMDGTIEIRAEDYE